MTSVSVNEQASYNLKALLERDGYVSIPNPFTENEINSFRAASKHSIELTRNGSWPHLRSLPKQFPPWTADVNQGIWGVQHLLHPDMPERDIFAMSYFHDAVVDAVMSILDCQPNELVMELYNLLIRPDRDFALRWHRDDIGPDTSTEDELKRLKEPMMHAQWNLALYEDSSLIVVPGSHKRARTQMERGAYPYEDDMPGQKIVKLSPGDIVFYNNNILHRGVYDSTTERMTLHGSMGVTGADPARARVIFQHGIGEWASTSDFSGLPAQIAARAEYMKQNLIAVGASKGHGFSQAE